MKLINTEQVVPIPADISVTTKGREVTVKHKKNWKDPGSIFWDFEC